MQLSVEQIKLLQAEIERQWLHHVMVRAAFPNQFFRQARYQSRRFYKTQGIELRLEWLELSTDAFRVGSTGLTEWLNQNWVIRLYGILDSHKLIAYGQQNKVAVIRLIDHLRNNVGAHSTGKNPIRRKKLRRAAELMKAAIGKETDIENIESFNLAVDSVLYPIKNKVIEFLDGLGSE